MIEPHSHSGGDSARVNVKDLTGPSLETADLQVSARDVNPTLVQRGIYTLAAGVKFVQFPYQYSSITSLVVMISSDAANQQFLQGVVVSGFTVSGSGTNTGSYLAVGYK